MHGRVAKSTLTRGQDMINMGFRSAVTANLINPQPHIQYQIYQKIYSLSAEVITLVLLSLVILQTHQQELGSVESRFLESLNNLQLTPNKSYLTLVKPIKNTPLFDSDREDDKKYWTNALLDPLADIISKGNSSKNSSHVFVETNTNKDSKWNEETDTRSTASERDSDSSEKPIAYYSSNENEGRRFRRIQKGFLNKPSAMLTFGRELSPSSRSFGKLEFPVQKSLPRREHLTTTVDQSTLGIREDHRGDYVSDRQMSAVSNEAPSDQDEQPHVVDKVLGIDLSDLGPAGRIKNKSFRSQTRSNKLNLIGNVQQDRHGNFARQANPTAIPKQLDPIEGNDDISNDMSNLLCQMNRFDRIIAERMAVNNLSRPLVKASGRYENPFDTWKESSVVDIFKFGLLERDESNAPKNQEELDKELPLLKPDFRIEEGTNASEEFRVTWIGHSTLVIQIDGLNILTDPIFSKRASPVQMFGPKRIRSPATLIKYLPRIDIVVISHNHYDHLDSNSVKELNERFRSDCRWIVPLGLGEFMKSMSVENYVELNWWQKDCFQVPESQPSLRPLMKDSGFLESFIRKKDLVGGSNEIATDALVKEPIKRELDVYLTPTQHWTGRSMTDNNKSLWGSFTIVSSSGSTFFFGGDTGYCSAFKEIGEVFGPFSGAAIPIGAYKPRWFLKPMHVDPAEAVQVHRDIKSARSIAIHHSTFLLSNEHYKEPVNTLNEITTREKLRHPFTALKHGQTMNFPRAQPTQS